MTPERWKRVKEIVAGCLDLEPEQRTAYMQRVCGGDTAMRLEVESLVRSYTDSGDPLEDPALADLDTGPETGMAGRVIGAYRIVEEIGEGGMSRVYLAVREDGASAEPVAVKFVKRGMDYDFILRRFRHERQIMAALEHPNIARLLDGGTTEDGVPYFVLEYIDGQAIDEYCDTRQLTVSERLELFRTVCSAVEYAHQRRIIHRDIKPGNILITREGVPKLLDFGIAKILNPEQWTQSVHPTASVLRLMTPEYASPEQVRGDTVSEATDVYALGVLLYELLTGHRPYRLRSRAPHELAHAICESEPGKPSSISAQDEEVARLPGGTPVLCTAVDVSTRRRTVPKRLRRSLSGDLDNILLMALRKEPRRRYRSVADLSEDIRRYLEHRPVTARKDTLVYRTGKLVHRHRTALWSAAAGVAVAAAVAIGAAVFPRSESPLFGGSAAPRVAPFTTLAGNETQPVFSPDGSSIAFVWAGDDGRNSDIYIRRLEGGPLRRITTDPAEDVSPAWSPDGTRIAFLRTKKNNTAVFIAPLAGGVHAQIAEVYPNRIEAVGRHLDWSPDGQFLAVADKPGADGPFSIYLVKVSDSTRRKLTSPPEKFVGDFSPAFSPDGRSIAFVRAPSSGVTDVYVMPLAGGAPRRVTADNRTLLAETWTSDSRRLVFASNRTGSLNLWWVDARGGAPRRVPGIGDGVSEPTISRDGRHMAYSQSFNDANIWRVAVAADGRLSDPRKLIASTQYDSSAQYSPDGTRMAFRSNRSGYNEIWTCDAECRNPVQLTHFEGPLTGSPHWSPDGNWIAFDTRPEGQADIYAIPSGGGAPRRITHEPAEDVVPNWSRDGKWIYFASNRSGSWQVWKSLADGTDPKVQVTKNGGFAAYESLDGKYLYYTRSRSTPGLYRMPLGGGEESPVLERLQSGFWGYWTMGRRGIYFAQMPDGGVASIWFLPFSGAPARPVFPMQHPVSRGDAGLCLSPDEKFLLFTQIDQSGSDLMLASAGQP